MGCHLFKKLGKVLGIAGLALVMNCMVVKADVTSLITDFKPDAVEVTKSGEVTNAKGEKVTVSIVHPGVGMTKKELDSMRDHVRAGDEPWASAFEEYAAMGRSSLTPRIFYENNDDFVIVPNVWTNNARKEYVGIRGNWDGSTAVAQAIMWYVTGNETYRKNCMNIIRSWSKVESITAEKDFRWGITSYQICMAAEIMRYAEGQSEEAAWTETDTANLNRFLDQCNNCNKYTDFFWMNQHDFVSMGIMGIGIFQDDLEDYAKAVEMTMVNDKGAHGGNNGSIMYQCRLMTANEETGEEIPKEEQTVQLIEAGRDQGHAYATISALSTLAQSIYVQKTKVDPETGEISDDENAVNPFEFKEDRLLKGVVTALRYNLGYEDNWITADSSRGYYREPNGRGRIGESFGILYNYYRYVAGKDMTESDICDLARIYERYMPEVTTSNDYPLAATLLYLPDNAKDNFTKSSWYPETATKKEAENYSALLSGSAEIKKESDITFVHMDNGTEIATCTYSWPKEGGMGLRVRSDGNARVEVRAVHNTNAPKVVFEIPDTKGKWMTITANTEDTGYLDEPVIYYRVEGKCSYLDLDYMDFNSKETKPISVETDAKSVQNIYWIPVSKTTEFQVDFGEGAQEYSVESDIGGFSYHQEKQQFTITPAKSLVGQKGVVSIISKSGELYGYREFLIGFYENESQITQWTEKKKQLIASYDMEESGDGILRDTSGNNNNGRYYKKAVITEDVQKGSRVLSLPGIDGSFAKLPQGLLDGCEEFTIQMDVKTSMSEGNFYTYGIGSDNYRYTYLKLLDSQVVSAITDLSYTKETAGSASIENIKDRWISLAAVYEKDLIKIYLDRNLVMIIETPKSIADLGNHLNILLGKSFYINDLAFSGAFDNVEIYNYAIPDDQFEVSNEKLKLQYSVGAGGWIEGESEQSLLKGEKGKLITLHPYPGYTFMGWSDGCKELKRSDRILEDKNFHALFRKEPETNLLAYYPMDESYGSYIIDESGNGFDMELFGNAGITMDEQKESRVLELDGTTETYAKLPAEMFYGSQEFTISMDVKKVQQVAQNYMTFVVGTDTNRYFFYKIMESKMRTAITKASYHSEQAVEPSITTENNRWTHIDIVLTGTGMKLYQDGVLLGSNDSLSVSMEDLGENLQAYIGKSLFGVDGYFKGGIDNLKIYNEVLSDAVLTNQEKEKLTLLYQASHGGYIEGEAKQELYAKEKGTKVTAKAKEGYRFVRWSDGCTELSREDTLGEISKSIVACFERYQVKQSDHLLAAYEMSYSADGVLSNLASLEGERDAKAVGMEHSNFEVDADGGEVLVFKGDKNQYVELPKGLLKNTEAFTIKSVYKTGTKANHWLFTMGNIVDSKNYLFVNPMTPQGGYLCGIKDNTTEVRVIDSTDVSNDVNEYHSVVLSFDYGKIKLYLDGKKIAEKVTNYSMESILSEGTEKEGIGYIGKSLWAADPAFIGEVKAFYVFDGALSLEELEEEETALESWINADSSGNQTEESGENSSEEPEQKPGTTPQKPPANLITYKEVQNLYGKTVCLLGSDQKYYQFNKNSLQEEAALKLIYTPDKPKGVKISASKKTITVKWKMDKKTMGYKIYYTTDKKFKKSVKCKNVKKGTASVKLKHLKSKKKYYIKIVAVYRKNGVVYESDSVKKSKRCAT